MSMFLLLSSLAVLLLGGVAAIFTGKTEKGAYRIGVASCLTGAALAIISAGIVMWTGDEASIRVAWQVPFGSFYLAIDPLAAFFIIVISLVSGLASVYGSEYLQVYRKRKNLGSAWCFYNILFASMLLVVASRNGILFLVAWEAMSFSSFFLVMFEHEKSKVREAGWIYLVAAHVGQACLMFLFIMLGSQNNSLDFDKFLVPSGFAGVAFILTTVGFGTKAGFLPLHVWLPDAHPAAPSHVSAVMSGVMIKTGIYGLIRIITLIGAPAQWWGYTLLIIGAVSGVIGVLLALSQHDIKRLLAYHSVENIGIITLGLGLWLLGVSTNNYMIAAMGLMGGLLHVLNHAVFKSLLFLGAGSVVHAAGTREMDLMGGLMKKMPLTAFTFGIGSAAICGLPPLNGFVSEFLIYLGAFNTMTGTHPLNSAVVLGGLITIIALGLIGGLATACFTKVFGTVFLGNSRSSRSTESHENTGAMVWVMIILAAFCIILGLAGPVAVNFIRPVASQLLGDARVSGVSEMLCALLFKISLGGAALIIIAGILWSLRGLALMRRVKGFSPTWDCGYSAPTSRMQYTSSSFAWPIVRMFRWVLQPEIHNEMGNGFFPGFAALSTQTHDIFRRFLYTPLFRLVTESAQRVHKLQEGRNQLYVLYIAITILVLLLVKVR